MGRADIDFVKITPMANDDELCDKYKNLESTDQVVRQTHLGEMISEYNEVGPYLTHLPQYVFGVKYLINQYRKKLPEFQMCFCCLLDVFSPTQQFMQTTESGNPCSAIE